MTAPPTRDEWVGLANAALLLAARTMRDLRSGELPLASVDQIADYCESLSDQKPKLETDAPLPDR